MPNARKDDALKSKPIGVSLPPMLAHEARRHAYANNMSLSTFIRQLLFCELKSIENFPFDASAPAQAKPSISVDDSTNQFPQKSKPHQSSDRYLVKTH